MSITFSRGYHKPESYLRRYNKLCDDATSRRMIKKKVISL